ncbi:MAG: hypothetical protein ACP5VF_03730 [Acidobacteriota bacterium]
MSDRRKRTYTAGLALLFVSCTFGLFAAGGLSTSPDRAHSSTTLTVTIPGIVAVDVEGELAFDLGSAGSNRSERQAQGGEVRNVFPPPPNYHGPLVFDASNTRIESALAAAPPASGSLAVAIFCNKEHGNLQIQAAVGPTWSPASGPGFPTSAIRIRQSSENNPYGVGGAQPVHLSSALTPLSLGTLPNRFAWTRMDLHFDIELPDASKVLPRPGTYTTVITLTVTKS